MAEQSDEFRTLEDIEIGDSAVVIGFTAIAPARRFLEMGFVPGTTVRALRRAPLGDPIEFAVMGGRIAMRATDASMILVAEAP
ncbi:MAG: FeoA family protein [Actinomycetota bacterium]|nr:FeoA family protein [Actinomycetota bacterium]